MSWASGRAVAIGRLIGWTAIVASLGFIGLQLWRHTPWQLASMHLRPLTIAVVVGALLYGMAGFLLSTAWHQLLGADDSNVPIRWHHAVYGRTQIAKYLPGNVFHLVGRQVMGRRLGHGQASLAMASLLEVLLLVLVAACLILPIVWRRLDPAALGILALVAPALALIVARSVCRRRPALLGPRSSGHRFRPVARLLRAAALYVGFFLVVAVVFWMLARSLENPGSQSIDLVTSISVVALAWLIGFATPGSSAGIGVREAVLIAALEGMLGAPASTLIALALRVVSIGGDVLFFILGMMIGPTGRWPKSIPLGGDLA